MNIRQAEHRDISNIRDLFHRNQFSDPSLRAEDFEKCYCWLFRDNPAAVQFSLVADHEGTLLAHTGMMPIRYQSTSGELVGGLGSNLVVDEAARKGMLFFQLQSKYLREYSKANISFAYGLVNKGPVLETHLRTGYTRVADLPVLARPYRFSKLVQHVFPNPLLSILCRPFVWVADRLVACSYVRVDKRIDIQEIIRFDKDADDFLQRQMKLLDFAAVRTRETLNWRFVNPEFRGYKLFAAYENAKMLGYVVIRLMDMRQFKTLAVVDLLVENGREDVARALLVKVHQLAKEFRVDLATTMVPIGSKLQKYFSRFGYLKTPEQFTLIIAQPKGKAVLDIPEIVRNFSKKWYITWFDHDFV